TNVMNQFRIFLLSALSVFMLVTAIANVAVPALDRDSTEIGVANVSAAVEDPERNATTPIRWHCWTGRSKEGIDQLAQNADERVINVQVDSTSPLRFSAVMVKNTGPYARTGDWAYGSEADVTNKLNAENGRLIDLEPCTVNGQRRFAYIWVRNTGAA